MWAPPTGESPCEHRVPSVLRLAVLFAACCSPCRPGGPGCCWPATTRNLPAGALEPLHGHPFESTLSSQLSTDVIHAREPSVDYERLGQRFTPPSCSGHLLGLIGGAALPLVQVELIGSWPDLASPGLGTAAGTHGQLAHLRLLRRQRPDRPHWATTPTSASCPGRVRFGARPENVAAGGSLAPPSGSH